MKYTEVNIHEEKGRADDYVVMEKGQPDTALLLLGWDEVGLFDHNFKHPVYARIDKEGTENES